MRVILSYERSPDWAPQLSVSHSRKSFLVASGRSSTVNICIFTLRAYNSGLRMELYSIQFQISWTRFFRRLRTEFDIILLHKQATLFFGPSPDGGSWAQSPPERFQKWISRIRSLVFWSASEAAANPFLAWMRNHVWSTPQKKVSSHFRGHF